MARSLQTSVNFTSDKGSEVIDKEQNLQHPTDN